MPQGRTPTRSLDEFLDYLDEVEASLPSLEEQAIIQSSPASRAQEDATTALGLLPAIPPPPDVSLLPSPDKDRRADVRRELGLLETEFDEFSERDRAWTKDAGIVATKAALGVPAAAIGLADMATFIANPWGGAGHLGKQLGELGFDPAGASAMLDYYYSDRQKRANQTVAESDGMIETAINALRNPSVIAASVGESLPLMVGGAGVARAVAARGVPMAVAAGMGEGAMSVGASTEQVRQESATGTLTPSQALLTGGSGAVTGAIGAFGARLAQKLGIVDVETMLAGAAKDPTAATNLYKAIVLGGLEEGMLEEFPQSLQEQVAQNLATGKPWHEGTSQQAVLGAIAGGVVGSGVQAVSAATSPTGTTGPSVPPVDSAGDEAVSFGRRLGQTILDKLGLAQTDQVAQTEQAPGALVTPDVDLQGVPPTPVEPLDEPGRTGDQQIHPDEILPPEEFIQPGRNSTEEIRESDLPVEPVDIETVKAEPDEIPGKSGQLNVPAAKVEYASITDEDRRELRRMLREMQEFGFEPRTMTPVPRGQGQAYDVVAGSAGAPVFNDIVTTDRKGRPQGTRGKVIQALQVFLQDGKRSAISDRAVDVAKRRAAGDRTLSKPSLPDEAGDLPFGMKIERRSSLSTEARAVEDRFARAIEADPLGVIQQYRDRFDNVANSDLAKELASDVYGSPEQRTANSRALHQPSHELARGVFRQILEDEIPEGRTALAVFTAGGTGSGKTSSLGLFSDLEDTAHVIYDSTFAETDQAIQDVQAARDSGHEVGIVFTLRDIVESFTNGVLPRAIQGGRPVSIDSHVRTHIGALDTVRAVAKHFHDDPKVSIFVVNNPAKGERELRGSDLRGVEAIRYDAANVRTVLARELDAALEARRISRPLYDAVRDTGEGLASDPPTAGPRPSKGSARGQGPTQEARRRSVDTEKSEPRAKGKDPLSDASGDARGGKNFVHPLPARRVVDKPKKQMRLDEVVQKLSDLFGRLPVSTGRFRQQALGIYKPGVESIRVNVSSNLQTILHEFGHHLDLAIMGIDRSAAKNSAIATELRDLGQVTSRDSYTVAEQRSEGAAEFFRLWNTEPEVAAERAPTYTAAFEDYLTHADDGLGSDLRTVQQQVQGYLSLDALTQLGMKIDMTGGGRGGVLQQAADWMAGTPDDPRTGFDRFIDNIVDDLDAIGRAERDMGFDQETSPWSKSAKILAHLARTSSGQARTYVRDAIRDAEGRFVGPGLFKAFEPVWQQIRTGQFDQYLVGKRAQELNKLQKETGITTDQAASIDRFDQDPGFVTAAARTYEFQDAMLDYAVRERFINAKTAALFRQLYQAYVPFRRVSDAMTGRGPKASRGRLNDLDKFFKRFQGSGDRIVAPTQAIISNTFHLVDVVEHNKALLALVDRANEANIGADAARADERPDAKGSARWIELIPTKLVPTKVDLSQIKDSIVEALEGAGINLDELGFPPDQVDLDGLATIFTPSAFNIGGKNIVTVIRDGTREWYEVHDTALYEAITAAGQSQTPRSLAWWKKLVRGLKTGVTATVGFMYRNLARDTQQAELYRQGPPIKFLKDTLGRGLFAMLGNDESWQQFQAARAGQASLVSDRDYAREELDTVGKTKLQRLYYYTVRHPLHGLQAIGELSDTANRLVAFRRVMDTLGPSEEAMIRGSIAGKEITQDFRKLGHITREMNNYVAFLGAFTGGWARLIREIKKHPTQFAGRGTAWVALPSIAFWMLNHDDPDYDEIPGWQKASFYHAKIRGTHSFAMFPRPFDVGDVMNGLEAGLDWIVDKDPTAADRLPFRNKEEAAWFILSWFIPTAVLPSIEVFANYNLFFGRHIVNEWDTDIDADLQYSRWTSETAKLIGRLAGYSPAKIDHLINGHLGTLGRSATKTIDTGLGALGLVENPPDRGMRGWPLVNVLMRTGSMSSDAASISAFYEERERLEGRIRSDRRLKESGRPVRGTAEDARKLRRIRAAERQIRVIRDAIDKVFDDQRMAGETKSAALDRLYVQWVQVARKALGTSPLDRDTPDENEPAPDDVLEALGMGQ